MGGCLRAPVQLLNNIENHPAHIPFTHKESEFISEAAGDPLGSPAANGSPLDRYTCIHLYCGMRNQHEQKSIQLRTGEIQLGMSRAQASTKVIS
jgi:hypothetical protein